jgi:demethylmenaquinone methyltransferase/2-methoxy-6-polyprenyl-1,4-benzoquinol methylase
MSTLVFMKVLESTPSRYDRAINFLTFGKILPLYQRLTEYIKEGDRVLDIGCGTGLITLLAAEKGAVVRAIDINPEMLNIAKKRMTEANLSDSVEFMEIGVAELDKETDNSYDYVYAGMVFSELNDQELNYTLRHIQRILDPEGKLILVDEINPKNPVMRILNLLIRIPLVIITYIFTQTTTKKLKRVNEKIEMNKFIVEEQEYLLMGSLTSIICRVGT